VLKTEKKVFILGGVKVVCLPKQWVRAIEKKYGRPLNTVNLEIDGETLKITPRMEAEELLEEAPKKQSIPAKQPEIEDLV
jgi:hypothetical protein